MILIGGELTFYVLYGKSFAWKVQKTTFYSDASKFFFLGRTMSSLPKSGRLLVDKQRGRVFGISALSYNDYTDFSSPEMVCLISLTRQLGRRKGAKGERELLAGIPGEITNQF